MAASESLTEFSYKKLFHFHLGAVAELNLLNSNH